MKTSSFNKKAFQTALIEWFKLNQRQLPWREDQDPYKVWVSEIMLQQTQVDTVIPYFENFIEQFPDPNTLADADQQEVLKAWEGLGYYSRVRNLHTAVQEVKEKYHGEVPRDREQLSKLKGVGPYTLGAIMSIAYDEPEPAVDGNVMRVISRVFEIDADIAKAKSRKIFESLVRDIISEEDPSSFNQGLMELGALICRPKNPQCELCPIQSFCRAYQQNSQSNYPVKSKAKKQIPFYYYVFVLENKSGEILIEQRPESGLLAGFWQFPMVEQKELDQSLILPFVEEIFQIDVQEINQLKSIKHIFSHLTWSLDVYHLKVDTIHMKSDNQRLVKLDQLAKYPFPVPHQKVINQL